jgi:recombinational DNA repair protein (RecF pathway)
MPKVSIQKCYVLKITPWEDHKSIITLLSRERAIFSALHVTDIKLSSALSAKRQLSQRKKWGAELTPNLFHKIEATLHFKDNAKHRLLDFSTIGDSFPCSSHPSMNLHHFSGMCLLSKILQHNLGENQNDTSPYLVWKNQCKRDFQQESWLELLCELHYMLGTWPQTEQCEICGRNFADGDPEKPISKDTPKNNLALLHQNIIKCQPCGGNTPMSERLADYINERFSTSRSLALPSEDAKLLRRLLWKRLPNSLHNDPSFKKLVRVHFFGS